MNQALEFHDSTLISLSLDQGIASLHLEGVVHQSPGRPGMDAGSCWETPILIEATDATLHHAPGLPTRIYDGQIAMQSGVVDNMVMLPASLEGPVQLRLETDEGNLWLTASMLRITAQGPGMYVDEFSGDADDR